MASSSSYDKKMREGERKATAIAATHIQQLPAILDKADAFLVQWPVVEQVASQAGIRPSYIVPLCFSLVMLFVGWFDDVITNGVGFFYPAWQSFKAIESKGTDDDKQWLTYWVVFAAFSFVEMFSNILLFWVPFYYVLKVAFLLWLLLPQFQGAKFVYNKAVRPILLHNEKKIEGIVERLNGQAEQIGQIVNDVASAATAAQGVRRRVAGDVGGED